MKAIAKRRDGAYLIVNDDVDELESDTAGRVLDPSEDALYMEMNANSILRGGYWRPYAGSQSMIRSMIEAAENVDETEYPPPVEEKDTEKIDSKFYPEDLRQRLQE